MIEILYFPSFPSPSPCSVQCCREAIDEFLAINDAVRGQLAQLEESRQLLQRKVDAGEAESAAHSHLRLTEFLCPISHSILADPVSAEDGHTYSRLNIRRWIAQREAQGQPLISPVTRKPMGSSLMANAAVRERLYEALAQLSDLSEGEMMKEEEVVVVAEKVVNKINDKGVDEEDKELATDGAHSILGEKSGRRRRRRHRDETLKVQSMGQLNTIFSVLDGLEDVLQSVLEGWEPPRVVIIGNQSHGKSTVLERLCMVPLFPRAKSLCTSVPIKINVRRAQCAAEHEPVSLEVWDTAQNKRIGEPQIIPLDSGAVDIREAMREAINAQNVQVSVDRELRVRIYSSSLPPMNLIDLPGTVEYPLELQQRTHTLVDRYMADRRDSSVFLVVTRAEGSSPTQCAAMKHISKHGAEAHTIGVLTFCDRLDTEEDFELLRGWLANTADAQDSVPLQPYGYVATMNKELRRSAPDESNLSRLRRQANREATWFNENGLRSEVEQGRATSDALVTKIGTLYTNYVLDTFIPTTVQRLIDESSKASEALESLGQPESPGNLEDVDAGPLSLLRLAATDAAKTILTPCFEAAEQNYVSQTLAKLQERLIAAIPSSPRVSLRDVRKTLCEIRKACITACREASVSLSDTWQESVENALKGDAGNFRMQRFPRYVANLKNVFVANKPKLATGLLENIEALLKQLLDVDSRHVQMIHKLKESPPVAVIEITGGQNIVGQIIDRFVMGYKVLHSDDINKEISKSAQYFFGRHGQERETCHLVRARLSSRINNMEHAAWELLHLRCGGQPEAIEKLSKMSLVEAAASCNASGSKK